VFSLGVVGLVFRRHVPEMTCYMLSGMLNATYSLSWSAYFSQEVNNVTTYEHACKIFSSNC